MVLVPRAFDPFDTLALAGLALGKTLRWPRLVDEAALGERRDRFQRVAGDDAPAKARPAP